MADSTTQAATSPKPTATPPRVASPKSATSPKSAASPLASSPRATVSPKSPASPPAVSSPQSATAAGELGTDAALEVDHAQDDDEATLNEQLSAFTASLSSSVMDYPIEHGRRYHAYSRGSYLLPNDERELERLDVVHHLMVRTLGGRFFLAPIEEDKIQNVLDIGTGTGALAIEIADALPGAQVIGCDLSPTQTTWIPPNLKFEVDDVEREWAYPFKFDFIVCRQMASSITDWAKLIERIYENLNPGGWVELQDFDLEYTSDDGTLTEEHDFRKWNNMFLDGLAAINRTGLPGRQLRGWAEDAGFKDIQEFKLKVPMGSWPKDPYLKKTGMINLVQMLDGLEAFSLKTFDLLGWSRPETEVFLANVRREMKGNRFHAYTPFNVVYGQKPE